MNVHPVVRHMLLCDDYKLVDEETNRIDISGLMTGVVSNHAFGFGFVDTLAVLIVVSDARGLHRVSLECQSIDAEDFVFRTSPRPVQFGRDPLRVSSIGFRIRDCVFPELGGYIVRFLVDDVVLSETYLVVH